MFNKEIVKILLNKIIFAAEPVENVQEPEESDVCLIPDDTENEVTEAEKEQAMLVRENAEKEDAEAETEALAKKEKDKETADAAEQKETDDAAATAEGGAVEVDVSENNAEEAAAETVDENGMTVQWQIFTCLTDII